MIEHAIIELIKHLGEIEESIPDNRRLASILCAVGVGCIIGGALLSSLIRSSDDAGIPFVIGVLTGVLPLLLGAYIFFRRGIWKIQDKRKPEIISLNLKK